MKRTIMSWLQPHVSTRFQILSRVILVLLLVSIPGFAFAGPGRGPGQVGKWNASIPKAGNGVAGTKGQRPEASVIVPTHNFYVRNYGGKCLDYGAPFGGSGPTVFLNDCSVAHPILVQEIGTRHDVILHAGSAVIGIHNPPVNTLGGTPPPPQTEYALELQHFNPILATTRNQTFALDGDSIILSSSRPCANASVYQPNWPEATDPPNYVPQLATCPPAPAQLVIQIQNGRGKNGSPLVAGQRNLSDSEFWDFNAIDNSGSYPTTGFVSVWNNVGLWNASCQSPQVASLSNTGAPLLADGTPLTDICSSPAGWGTVIDIAESDPGECLDRPDVGPCIDLSMFPTIVLAAGVTVRSNRRGVNPGAQIFFSAQDGRKTAMPCTSPLCTFVTAGDYVRVARLRMHGESRSLSDSEPYTEGVAVGYVAADAGSSLGLARVTELIATVDHNEMSDWGSSAVGVHTPYLYDGNNSICLTGLNGLDFFVNINGNFLPGSIPCTCSVVDPTNALSGLIVPITSDPATLDNVRVERNFLHHNARWGGGYGVGFGRGVASGNTFWFNRHSIASDGEPHDEYRAWYNFVLSSVPVYDATKGGPQQDFDMHGTCGGYGNGSNCASYFFQDGIPGGFRVDIAGNTFLGTHGTTTVFGIPVGGHSYNFELRGHPCSTDYFRDNVTMRDQDSNGGGVINFHNIGPPPIPFQHDGPDFPIIPVTPTPAAGFPAVFDINNQFGNDSPPYTDPTQRFGSASLAVGDFDGDGNDDLLVATGTAWFYSPGGKREWRFLSAKTDTVDHLLFGDFDGDGRTDVVAMHGGQLVVSWGGISGWEVLNAQPCSDPILSCNITDMAVGKFLDHSDGIPRDDIFLADGRRWWLSSGGATPFNQNPGAASSFRRKDLLFGDFDADGKTDVFGVVGNDAGQITWSYSSKATSPWTFLQIALLSNVTAMVIADFNADGIADVGGPCGAGCWQISYGGVAAFQKHYIANAGPSLAGVGRFLGHFDISGRLLPADLLLWYGRDFSLSAGGTGFRVPYSTQEMR